MSRARGQAARASQKELVSVAFSLLVQLLAVGVAGRGSGQFVEPKVPDDSVGEVIQLLPPRRICHKGGKLLLMFQIRRLEELRRREGGFAEHAQRVAALREPVIQLLITHHNSTALRPTAVKLVRPSLEPPLLGNWAAGSVSFEAAVAEWNEVFVGVRLVET
eukprot:1872091-Rhodomonas_salina.1